MCIENADFVVCTLDKPFRKIRRVINEACVDTKKPVIFAGFAEHVGMIGPFVIPKKTACLECIENKTTEVPLKNVDVVPSFGPLCTIISSIIVCEVINFFTDYKSLKLIGCTLMFNILSYNVDIIKWDRKITCEKCGDLK